MKPSRSSGRHLDSRAALNYLEHLLPPARAAAVEAHLALPCAACRERLRVFGELLELMRRDRAAKVPGWLTERALAVLAPAERPSAVSDLVESIARLVFDSWAQPLPAAARRAVGAARRLRFALGEHAVEIEVEPEGSGALTVRGRLEAPDAPLHRIEIGIGAERLAAWPDAAGAFALERVPAGEATLTVRGPIGHFVVPPIELRASS